MFCQKCGNNVPDGSRFCSSCGNDTQAPIPNAGNAQQPVVQPSYNESTYGNAYGGVATKANPNTKKIVIIAAVIIALIAGAWFIMGDKSDPHESPEAVLNAWVKAYNAHDAGALCNLSADLKRNGNDPEMRRDYIEEFEEEFEYEGNDTKISVKILSVEYEGNNEAYVICDVTFTSNGKVIEVEEGSEFPCVKIGGKWYWED